MDHQNAPQETIFNDVLDTAPYEKSLKNARIWLYVVAAFQAGMGIFEFATIDDKTLAWIALIIDVVIGGVFLGLALWSRTKPYLSFVIALGLYVVFNVAFMALDSSNMLRGLLVKILVVIALVKAVRDAKKYEEIKSATL